MSSQVVVGTQWGDEGKGKIVDVLAEKADMIVRFQGGDNAGGSLTLAHSQNSQMSFMYGFFFVKFLIFAVVCVVIMI